MAKFLSLTLLVAACTSAKPTGPKLVLHESRPNAPAGWFKTSAAPPSTRINLRLGLPSSDFAGLEEALYEVSTPGSAKYGQHLSIDQVKKFMQPSNASVQAVHDWLKSKGVNANTLVGHGDWVGFSATVEQANDLFDANFTVFKHHDTGRSEIRTLQYSIPSTLKGHLELVHPTITFTNPYGGKPQLLPASVSVASEDVARVVSPFVSASCVNQVTPACLQALYGIPTTKASASKNSITVTGYLEQYAQQADLMSFLSQFRTDIASSTSFNLQTLDGGVNPQGQFLAGVEANLDIQYVIGLATGVPVNFLSVGENFQDGDLEGFLDTVNFVSAQSPISYVMTTSYGQDESTISQALAVKLCNAYASLGAQGVSILFSSGDGGVAGTQPQTCTKFVPTFPSDCPYLTSVGATTGINPEKAAIFSTGGFSNYFGIPSYQSKAVKSYIAGLGSTNSGKFNASGRGFPDVAAQGQNIQFYVNGGLTSINGTSASSPIFASVIGLLNDRLLNAGKPPLGFLNPWLYSTASSALNDVTSGSNPGCSTIGFPAKTGWDPVTGLGTPNFNKLVTAAGLY